MNRRCASGLAGSILGLLVITSLSGCGGESTEPSAAQKALDDLQATYDELAQDKLDDPVQWASDDLENIGDWEYKVAEFSDAPIDELEAALNALGDDRWQVIWVEETRRGRLVILKRPSVSLLSKIPLSQIGRMMIGGSDGDQ